MVASLAPDGAIFVTEQVFQTNGAALEDVLRLRRTLLLALPRYVTLVEDVQKRGVWVYRRPLSFKSRAIGAAKEDEIRNRPITR